MEFITLIQIGSMKLELINEMKNWLSHMKDYKIFYNKTSI